MLASHSKENIDASTLKTENGSNAAGVEPNTDTVNKTASSKPAAAQMVDSFLYKYKTVDHFFSTELGPRNPTAWVTQEAKRKHWFVAGKEGCTGQVHNRTFSYELSIAEISATVTATAKKKKDAKASAYKLMAIKLGEALKLLLPQSGASIEEAQKTSPPSAVQSKFSASVGQKAVPGTAACPPSAISLVNHRPEMPRQITRYTAEQIAALPGHPVIAFHDVSRDQGFCTPTYR